MANFARDRTDDLKKMLLKLNNDIIVMLETNHELFHEKIIGEFVTGRDMKIIWNNVGQKMAVIYKNTLTAEILMNSTNETYIALKIGKNNKWINLHAIYIPPMKSRSVLFMQQFDELVKIFEQNYVENQNLIVGDLNFIAIYMNGFIVEKHKSNAYDVKTFSSVSKFVAKFKLMQKNKFPNRHGNILDVFFSDMEQMNVVITESNYETNNYHHFAYVCNLTKD